MMMIMIMTTIKTKKMKMTMTMTMIMMMVMMMMMIMMMMMMMTLMMMMNALKSTFFFNLIIALRTISKTPVYGCAVQYEKQLRDSLATWCQRTAIHSRPFAPTGA